jgi:hypothetical protein
MQICVYMFGFDSSTLLDDQQRPSMQQVELYLYPGDKQAIWQHIYVVWGDLI